MGDESNRTQTDFAFQYKFFAGNSFYIAPEVYYMNYNNEDKDDHSLLKYLRGKLTTTGVGVRIGNQWQWEHFTLGVDWIGLGKNIIYWHKTQQFTSIPYTFTFLNLYLGWSF